MRLIDWLAIRQRAFPRPGRGCKTIPSERLARLGYATTMRCATCAVRLEITADTEVDRHGAPHCEDCASDQGILEHATT